MSGIEMAAFSLFSTQDSDLQNIAGVRRDNIILTQEADLAKGYYCAPQHLDAPRRAAWQAWEFWSQ
jgi:hypothetical protein